jgi:hypothetical protein
MVLLQQEQIMTDITLQENQAALILTADGDDIEVDISHEGEVNFAAALCEIIALKLVEDEDFRQDLMAKLEEKYETGE